MGSVEASWRSVVIEQSPTEMREALEQHISKVLPGGDLLEFSHSDPLDFKQRFGTTFQYHVDNYCIIAGDNLVFQIPYLGKITNASGTEGRRYPILYSSRDFRRYEMNIIIPEGYEVNYLPEEINIKNPHFDFHSSYLKKDKNLFFQAEYTQKAVKIPVEDYTDYRESSQELNTSWKSYVLFKKIIK